MFLNVCLVLRCKAFVLIVLSDEPRLNLGQRFVDRKLIKAPSNFIDGRSKVALLFGSLVILDVV